jgi:bifunctional DNase/RNase
MIEVKVWNLVVDEKHQSPVVILQSVDGTKRLPIWIGPPEASAIAMEITGKKFQRPLTHDLLVSILNGLGAKVRRVEITDLRENTFYAKIYLEAHGELLAVDARPSDSLAVALKSKARIFVAPHLFSSELDVLLQTEGSAQREEPSEEEKARELRSFIENLNPKDFGRFTF